METRVQKFQRRRNELYQIFFLIPKFFIVIFVVFFVYILSMVVG